MRRVLFFLILLFFSALCFAQQNSSFIVIGRVPDADDNRLYQIQVGAFRFFQNAETAYERLRNASLNPAYENFLNLTRIVINGVAARDVPSYLQRIRSTGFTEIIIRIDNGGAAVQPPVNNVSAYSPALEETIFPAGVVEDRAPITIIGGETPPPSVPAEEVRPVVEPEPLPVVAGQLLPAPENRRPQEGYRIGAEELRQQRNIVFSWDAVEGATAYVLTIRETSQGRREIFRTEPVEQLNFTFENLKLFDYNGTYVWQVEALRRNSQGIIEQRGRPGENTFTLNVPRPGRVKTRDTGVLYGN